MQLEPGMSTRTHRADLHIEGMNCMECPALAGSLLGTLVVGDSPKKVGHFCDYSLSVILTQRPYCGSAKEGQGS